MAVPAELLEVLDQLIALLGTLEEGDQRWPLALQLYDDVTELVEAFESDWSLHPKQERAEDLAHKVDELLYGGAAGGGKSAWMLYHAYHLSLKYPGHKTLMLRRTFPRLLGTLIKESMLFFSPKECRYKVQEKTWVFNNGSEILFGHCEQPDDWRNYFSYEFDLICFDEVTEFTPEQYTMIRTRNRTKAKQRRAGVRPHTVAGTNPGGIAHEFFLERFVEPTNFGESIVHTQIEALGRTKDCTVAYVPALVIDNPSMDEDYVFQLAQIPDPIRRKQLLEGDWTHFEGQYFPEFRYDVHVVQPFAIPPEWIRVRGIDYGQRAPFACLWVAFDWDGNAYVYRERYGSGLTATDQAKRVLAASKMRDEDDREIDEPIDKTVADPSIWARQGDGRTIRDVYYEQGLHCTKALNARVDGWNLVREYLRATPDDLTTGPYIRFFDGACPNLIRTLPKLVYDDVHPEDCDTTGEDHAPDALRYVLASRHRKAKRRPANERQGRMTRFLEKLSTGGKKDRHPVLGKV